MKWHKWFAWYPIFQLKPFKVVWLEMIERRFDQEYDYAERGWYYITEYRW
jgi:hypothetical protein